MITRDDWIEALRAATVLRMSAADHMGDIMSMEVRGKALQNTVSLIIEYLKRDEQATPPAEPK